MIYDYKLVGTRVVILSISLMMLASFASCKGGQASVSEKMGKEVPIKYAENLSVVEHEGFTEVKVRNPWDTAKLLQKYILVPTEQELPANLPEGTVVRTPVSNALVYSTVHNSLISEIGGIDAIGGVCNAEYVNEGEVKERLRSGRIADCGVSMSPDIEKIIKLHPQVIMLSPFENNDKYAKVGELGIPIIECADYMETSALGRAEWVKFYGLLFGKADVAEKMFGDVEEKYNALKEMASKVAKRPKVLIDQRYGQVWNVPGGESTMAGLIRDARGINPFDAYKQSGSVPLAPEKVLAEAYDADIWFVRYNQDNEKTLKELASDAPVNSQFKAYKEGNVYGCNTRYIDFYEETPFHPERLLENPIYYMHPEMRGDALTHSYYTQMR